MFIHELSRDTCWLSGAEVRSLENGPKHALSRYRILMDELPISDQNAAKILRPRRVDGAVEDDVIDAALAQQLGLWRSCEEGIDLAIREKLQWLD